MELYFSGNSLYGDDFSFTQIENWYRAEKEGYAGLGSKNASEYAYGYHVINDIHGFSKIKAIPAFDKVLGMGSAFGLEFEPIIHKIRNLIIVEPSDHLVSKRIGTVAPVYVKPEVDGRLVFENDTFDLITCLGTLHHIPNVSFVLHEIIRVLRPGGYLLLREPVNSMGDWRFPRKGLTPNERGIPLKIFNRIFTRAPVQVISKQYCFAMTSFLDKLVGRYFKKPVYGYRAYVYFDRFLSRLLACNIHYHAKRLWQRCAPSSVYFVIRKTHSGTFQA